MSYLSFDRLCTELYAYGTVPVRFEGTCNGCFPHIIEAHDSRGQRLAYIRQTRCKYGTIITYTSLERCPRSQSAIWPQFAARSPLLQSRFIYGKASRAHPLQNLPPKVPGPLAQDSMWQARIRQPDYDKYCHIGRAPLADER